jgi:hypothetical protein
MTGVFADVLHHLRRKRAWVVHGLTETGAGMDDISISGVTTLGELADGKVSSAVIDCRWLGIPQASVEELRGGGDAEGNAKILTGILSAKCRGRSATSPSSMPVARLWQRDWRAISARESGLRGSRSIADARCRNCRRCRTFVRARWAPVRCFCRGSCQLPVFLNLGS